MSLHRLMQDPGESPGESKTPFQVSLRSASAENAPVLPPEDGEVLSLDEIEAAYLRALATADGIDVLVPPELPSVEPKAELPPVGCPSSGSAPGQHASGEGASATSAAPARLPEQAVEPDVDARQVVEALLFVGGPPLASKRILEILGGHHTHEQVEEILEQLNSRYSDQGRPYVIRLGEGGYRLQLREEFEFVRRRVYGQGPREIKLGQDALEILAFVAYRQPVTRAGVEETGRPNVAAILRQLLRRQLISLDRNEDDAGQVYRTTARFLELFGLASLDDLPQAVDFDFK